MSLTYDSGAGNGAFGFGWSLSLPAITRRTDRGVPRYLDANDSDVFVLSGAEDLVPLLVWDGSAWREDVSAIEQHGVQFRVRRYRPRGEGLFARIERWTELATGEQHWRSISKENVTTLYGRTAESRIADPTDTTRVFSWLICESYDDLGNASSYRYKSEDSNGVSGSLLHEKNRTRQGRTAHRYLKRILYGNLKPSRDVAELTRQDWMFEVVLDYGEHDHEDPTPDDVNGSWICRRDPISSYRSGFEVRQYRLCQRILLFHHFPAEDNVGRDCLVSSTGLAYREDPRHGQPVGSFIASIKQRGYRRVAGGYRARSLPQLDLEYSLAVVHSVVVEVDAESIENLPNGLDGTNYQWVDLDGEGISGVLTEHSGAWFYKANQGEGRFGPMERLIVRPSLADLANKRQQLVDLAGDGRLDLVQLGGIPPGFYERTAERGWDSFKTFAYVPNIAWDDPNLRFVDLTGDGHADVMITEDEAIRWYPSLAEDGFGPPEQTSTAIDEERGPRLIFADGTDSIYLADMSGDGLTDLVRIRNGAVSYWPCLGHGRFGTKVAMDDSPWLDLVDQFDHRRVRLADIDGTGNTDIVYLGSDRVRIYFNQSGNRWSTERALKTALPVDNIASVTAADLLGTGTACLVWSSPLTEDAARPMRYVDLMGSQKPHMLTSVRNNLGAECRVRYAPSTRFYLADKAAGRPWETRLPFPVHVVERIDTYDHVSRNRFVTRYEYHDGFFDGAEREFRGFGLVDQWDTEELAALRAVDAAPTSANSDPAAVVPPVLTRTWFHTGAYIEGASITRHAQGEYFSEAAFDPAAAAGASLGDSVLPSSAKLQDGSRIPWRLSAQETREACRAFKGSVLRQETYASDGTEASKRPYAVSEGNHTVELLQPAVGNQHAVFQVHPREALQMHYERRLYASSVGTPASEAFDPRVSHTFTLDVDSYGNVLRTASVAHGRRWEDATLDPSLGSETQAALRGKQRQLLITYTENVTTNAISDAASYRTPHTCETSTYELIGATPASQTPGETTLFRFDELQQIIADASDGQHDIPYEDIDGAGAIAGEPCQRLIERLRTLYRRDDLDGTLPLGVIEPRGQPFETYRLAFSAGLLSTAYRRERNGALEELMTDAVRMLRTDGGYVRSNDHKALAWFPASDPDDSWWIPSGRCFYSPDRNDAAADELAYARQHFFLPLRFHDPFNQITSITRDRYDLLVQETRDAAGNRVVAGEREDDGSVTPANDYRVLQARLVTDPNGNRMAVAFDALGMIAGTAVMGKRGEPVGDSLADFEPDLSDVEIVAQFEDPTADPHDILKGATTRLVYDLDAYARNLGSAPARPVATYTIARETHEAALARGAQSNVQRSITYSDGFGREVQKKAQAERDPAGVARWVGDGWTIFNNKGKPVRRYEPFFSNTAQFEFAKTVGVSSVLFYDPVERVVATLHANHTHEKVIFDPWSQETWDVNDTLTQGDLQTDPDIASFLSHLPDEEYLPTWYQLRTDDQQARIAWPDADPVTGAALPENAGIRAAELAAAAASAVHADTPTTAYFDSLGRAVLTVSQNRFQRNGIAAEQSLASGIDLDIEGNQRRIIDARLRTVMTFDYDMLGNVIHQASMEAGARWTLNDVTGNPIYAWDDRSHAFRTVYDALRRPTEIWMREGSGPEVLIERTVYGETRPSPEVTNLRGQLAQINDSAGTLTNDAFDFKGNLLQSTRQLALDYKGTPNWASIVGMDAETFISNTTYDALNRPTTLAMPDDSVVWPAYNEAGLLEGIKAYLQGTTLTAFVTAIDYNAKGQRVSISYGNGVRTTYDYDPKTFRLTHLRTSRGAAFPDDCPANLLPSCGVQNLRYTYDPSGNITRIRDDAQQTVFFRNGRVEPSADFTYDALYRLIEASGREHLGQTASGAPRSPAVTDHDDTPRIRLPHPNVAAAMGRYVQQYIYDQVGNIMSTVHHGTDPAQPGWTRTYRYAEPSQIDPVDDDSNRLSSTEISGATVTYTYDAHGNMITMPHLPLMRWNHRDQLQASARQVVINGTPETTYYVYDASGRRVRKVTERQAAQDGTPTRKAERIYLGGYDVYREYGGDGVKRDLERQTLHIMDGQQRVALVETRSQGIDRTAGQLIRYQHGNHIGSATLELDAQALVISYEEYYPYGSTSYQAVRRQTETPKRYRYTRKERDEENCLSYHDARYYASWLGRWTAADPAGLVDGPNLYAFARQDPVRYSDRDGRQSSPVEDEQRYSRVTAQAGHGSRAAVRGMAPVEVGAATNKSFQLSGKSLSGTYHLWSGDTTGKVAAKAAITPKTPGYIMGQTPQHIDAKARFDAATAGAGGAKLQDPEFRRIWDSPSETIAVQATAAEHPVATHGTPGPESVQTRIERPAVQRSGTISGGLTVASGAANIYAATQSESTVVKAIGLTGGAAEVAGGVTYAAGALKVGTPVATKLMQVGSTMSRFGGGVAGGVVSAYALVKDIQRGDVARGVGDAAGTATGVLTVIGAGSAAAVTGAFSAGYAAGTLINEHLLGEETKEAIGGTLNEIVNEGGWKELLSHPFGIGM